MTVKEKTLELLINNQNKFISGEDIATILSVTRASVWKAVNALKEDGYNISAVTNKGYTLNCDTDIMTLNGINSFIENKEIDVKLYKTVDSTNTVLKNLASDGAKEGTVVISSCQTAGRGRFKRKFYSPDNSGIYMSILVRPNMKASDATLITTAAAVSVLKATELLTDNKAEIKWVNDVLINKKKICGILTEASLDIESGSLDYAIVGIGINAYEPQNGFDDEIKNIAGAVFDNRKLGLENKLAAQIINNFFDYYNSLENRTFLNDYKSHCFVLGKKIKVLSGNEITPATAIDIDDNCKLLVEYENGKREYLSSGEISIRL